MAEIVISTQPAPMPLAPGEIDWKQLLAEAKQCSIYMKSKLDEEVEALAKSKVTSAANCVNQNQPVTIYVDTLPGPRPDLLEELVKYAAESEGRTW